MTTDPLAGLRKAQLMMAITQRVIRAWRAGEWALLHQVRPDGSSTPMDPAPFMPDEGSSLDLDDLDFMPELRGNTVSSTARFPVSVAAENLVGAGQAHSANAQEHRTSVASMGALCRCAIEASAKTIWLLAPEERDERRARCLGYNQSERQPQQAFIRVEERVLQKKQENGQPADFENFSRHRSEYDKRQAIIGALPRDQRKKPPGNYLDIVDWSAKWIDAHPPAHAAQEMGYGMELAAERFYSYGSSFVHGYKWMTDYIKNDEQSLSIIADGFAAAVIMTESAICLFEAQCTTTAGAARRRKNYPEWLIPTIDAWIPRYQ